MLVGFLLAASGFSAPADGHSVIRLRRARPDTELVCGAPLKDAFLTPASARNFGVRAPVVPGVAHCKLLRAKSRPVSVTLKFLEPKWPLAVGATGPVTLGLDAFAVLTLRGKATRADGSAGPATLTDGEVHAQLPSSKMPQNLVVLVEGEKGGAAYAVVPLLGRATVKVQTSKNASVEAVVAGHRTGGFTSNASGQASITVPSPVGFARGALDVRTPGGRTSHATIKLPVAKPLYAMAALGPAQSVKPGAQVSVWVAGADPLGLPPKRSALHASASAGRVKGLSMTQPGLWKVELVAPARDGEVSVSLALGNAKRNVTYRVGAPAPKPLLPPAIAEVAPAPAIAATSATSATLPASSAAPASSAPAPAASPAPTEPAPAAVAEAAPPPAATPSSAPAAAPAAELTTSSEGAPEPAPSGNGLRLELLVEGGYLTNGGALAGVVPGGQLQLAYRKGNIDIGGSVDALFSRSSHDSVVASGSSSVNATTTATTVQVLVGPWVRFRFNDVLGLDLTAGAGISHTSLQIDAAGAPNASGTSTPLALGGMAGLDLAFGPVRVFAGARYVTAKASGALTGQAGGLAGLLGVGVDLGL